MRQNDNARQDGAARNGSATQLGYTPAQHMQFKRHAWGFLLSFSFLYCFVYFARLNLSYAGAAMIEQLNWTTSDIGILTSSLFWTHAIGQLINGRLGERAGQMRIICIGVAGSVAANFLMGLQSSLWVMAIIWGINGYFQSMCWTPGMSAMANWWPKRSRGFASGFATAFSGFGQCGVAIVVAASFTLFPDMGWQAAFFIPALFPLAFLVVFRLVAKDSPVDYGLPPYQEEGCEEAPECNQQAACVKERAKKRGESRAKQGAEARAKKRGETQPSESLLRPYKLLLRSKIFVIWIAIAFLVGLVRYGLSTWIPLYFIQVHGIDISSGLLQSLALPIGMAAGSFLVPTLTDRFCPNNRIAGVIVSCIGAFISIVCFFFLDPTTFSGLILAEIALFAAGFCIYAVDGIIWAFAADAGGREYAGTASGVLNCSAYMGAAVQSLVYGGILAAGGWTLVVVSLAAFSLLIAGISMAAVRR